MISTVMVLIMVTIMAIFFFIVDQLLRLAVGGILQIG
jgi:preprotein translocase subunit SecE